MFLKRLEYASGGIVKNIGHFKLTILVKRKQKYMLSWWVKAYADGSHHFKFSRTVPRNKCSRERTVSRYLSAKPKCRMALLKDVGGHQPKNKTISHKRRHVITCFILIPLKSTQLYFILFKDKHFNYIISFSFSYKLDKVICNIYI